MVSIAITAILLSVSAIGVNVRAAQQPVPTVGEAITWEEYEWGSLSGTVLSDGIEISGAYDSAETTPLTGGFNNYFLLSDEVFTDGVSFSCSIDVADFSGTEAIVGIGIRAPSAMDFCYRDSILWCWYYYSAAGANSIGWLHECLDGIYERTTVDDADLTLGQSYEYRISVESGVISLFIDDECLFSEANPLSEFNIFLEVAVKYSDTYIDAFFEDISVQPSQSSVRAPISINGNGQFTAENGVVSGSGTEDDPFIIEGWEFHDYYVAIWIWNTDAHLIIRDIVATDGLGGIYLYYAKNISLVNVNLANNIHAGTYFNTVKNCSVVDSQVYNSGHEGVVLQYSEHVAVIGNSISSNSWEGVMVEYSTDVVICGNRITDNGFYPDPSVIEYLGYGGIYLVSVSECEISGNWIGQNVEGICAFQSSYLSVVGNYGVSGNWIGIALEDCTRSLIYWNNMLENGLQAEDIWTADLGQKNVNRWYSGAHGGNYWSDYIGPGPYVFDDNMDRRPLSVPVVVEMP